MNTETLFPLFLDFLVKTSLIVLLAGLVERLWRKPTAAQRYIIWNMALVALFALPIWNRTHPGWVIPLGKQPAKAEAPALSVLPAMVVASEPMESQPVVVEAAPAPSHWKMPGWRSVVLAVWIGGGVLLIGRRLVGSWQLYRLKKRSAVVDDERVVQLTQRVLDELKIKRRVEVRISTECQVPLTWGDWRPVVLLPAEALIWSDESLLAALRHEAGHIGQRHYADRLMADLVCAGYWVNPLVWLAAHQLRAVQEQATDDVVLQAGTSAEDYAAQLCAVARTVVERGVFKRPAMAMVSRSTLESRVVNILDASRKRQPLTRNARRVGMMITLFVVFAINLVQLRGDEATEKTGKAGARTKETGTIDAPSQAVDPKLAVLKLQPLRAEEESNAEVAKQFTLQVPIQAQAGAKVEMQDVVIHVLFYDQTSAQEIVPTIASVTSRWASPPIDWRDRNLEELSVEYRLSKAAAGDGRKYAGYLVRLYYQGKLQAAAAEPARLLEMFPAQTELAQSKTPASPAPVTTKNAVVEKAEKIVIPALNFREATVQEAIQFLGKKSVELDPEKEGVNLEMQGGAGSDARITVSLTNIPLIEALRYVAGLAGLEVVANSSRLTLSTPAGAPVANSVRPASSASSSEVARKAAEIIVPRIELREATVVEAVDFLRIKARELDPEKKGVNLILKGANPEAKLSLSLTNVPLREALHYVASLADLEVVAEPEALLLRPAPAKPAAELKSAPPAPSGPPIPPVDLRGDATRMENGQAIVEGHARLERDQTTVTADTIRYDVGKQSGEFRGNVEITRGNDKITGDNVKVTFGQDSRISIEGDHLTHIVKKEGVPGGGTVLPPAKVTVPQPVPAPGVVPTENKDGGAARGPSGAKNLEDPLGLRKPLFVESKEMAPTSTDKPAVQVSGSLQLRMTLGDRPPMDHKP